MTFSLRGITLLLAITAFIAPGVAYLNRVFTAETRWGVLAILALVLFFRGQLLRPFESRFGLLLGIYILWCVTTYFWSDVPQLSISKAIAFGVTATVFISAGQFWVSGWRHDSPLSFLQPVLLVALLAGLGANGPTQPLDAEVQIYRGLSGNPNYLGMLVATSFPLALYFAYQTNRERRSVLAQLLSLALLLVLAILLWKSGSRSSLLCVLATLTLFFSAFMTDTKVFVLIAAGFVAFSVPIVAPDIQQGVYTRFVVKGADNEDIFYTRRGPWEQSYRAALEGGIMGLGYGVSAGHDTFEIGLTASGYGREKGNSQLAIWEEIGLIGLAIYALLLASLARALRTGILFARSQEQRIQISLLAGLTFGMLLQSVFEAWWTAPGAPESAVFWCTVGAGLGLAQRAYAEAQRPPIAEAGLPVSPARGGARIVPHGGR